MDEEEKDREGGFAFVLGEDTFEEIPDGCGGQPAGEQGGDVPRQRIESQQVEQADIHPRGVGTAVVIQFLGEAGDAFVESVKNVGPVILVVAQPVCQQSEPGDGDKQKRDGRQVFVEFELVKRGADGLHIVHDYTQRGHKLRFLEKRDGEIFDRGHSIPLPMCDRFLQSLETLESAPLAFRVK